MVSSLRGYSLEREAGTQPHKPVKNPNELPVWKKLCGVNPREDGKIRLFLDNVGSQRVDDKCRWRDFWGPIDGIAVKAQQLPRVGSIRTDRSTSD
jgi:hypothetical protein